MIKKYKKSQINNNNINLNREKQRNKQLKNYQSFCFVMSGNVIDVTFGCFLLATAFILRGTYFDDLP